MRKEWENLKLLNRGRLIQTSRIICSTTESVAVTVYEKSLILFFTSKNHVKLKKFDCLFCVNNEYILQIQMHLEIYSLVL